MLINVARSGISVRRAMTVGRQSVLLHPGELRSIRKESGCPIANYVWAEYAERYLTECLGVETIDVLDYSDFEEANILHDLNTPIPVHLKDKYDLVIEAGTVEHVFNFPMAISNLMQMTKVGGMLSVSMVANNLCGHGFYQFSPELVFRVFTSANGFELGELFATEARYPGVELSPTRRAYSVTDPLRVHRRVGLQTNGPVMMYFNAKKIASVPLFERFPMQSDYEEAWKGEAIHSQTHRFPALIRSIPGYQQVRDALFKSIMGKSFSNVLNGCAQRKMFSFNNTAFFKRVE